LVDALERSGRAQSLLRALRHAAAFRADAGLGWSALLRDGLAMRRSHELTWSQLLLAANTPMLFKAAMVDGRTDLGVMASGQVAGLIEDLPSVQPLIDRIMAEAGEVLATLPRPA
jgi:NAD(P)H-dependent flavin oxidoreductase YrpB (nitropropane dioxygenase family)